MSPDVIINGNQGNGNQGKPGPELKAELLNIISGAVSERHDALRMVRREVVAKPVIFMGTGTCGLGAGAAATLEGIRGYLNEHDIDADIVEVGCIGLCACEPLMDVQLPGRPRLSFKHVTVDRVHPILDAVFQDELPEETIRKDVLLQFNPGDEDQAWDGVVTMKDHPFFGPQTRWVLENCGLIDPSSVTEYVARGGYKALASMIHSVTPGEVCSLVEQSGLRGRGGGGFKTGTKWKFAHEAQANQKYLICNADEGDPGAFMDRAVIEGDPHRLVEGMAIAAYAIGASKGYVYIRAEYPLAIKRLKEALGVARELGLLGHNILNSGFDFEIKIKEGAGAFVCGEETALINSIEGKRGMPRPRPPYPAVKGLFGKPTVINNVETLANLPILMRNGAEWFSSVGTAGSKGTKVFALSGKVVNTGLVEIPMGTSIGDIVMKIGGGVPGEHQFKAVQIGGPSGGCIPSQHIDTLVDYESLKTVGAMMGSGGLVVMDEKTCMVDLAKFFMDFIQRESCGKCIPCREGTRRMLEILQRITRGRRNEKDIEALERFQGVLYLERLGQVIKDTSLCGLGQTAPNPVLSTLRWFREEYEEHIYDRKCRAGACTELLRYSIDADKCIGCTLCARHCPTEAIMGAPKSPHYIIPDKCIGCGTCFSDCRHGAVIVE
ncbi:MAG TPA: NADH-ubiquinone oxidoreductase-F iron-sulfur binding region domain-containing protein [Myxococcota bacterium]|nr:NADH-ubiquinone oxidoreductase-F iron-sulfur binding region domain-containing protein [Myxococcota bacterium]HOA13110.1 NADH-ubiquinone oxidoreductase-F iron-sulfur binding region domain-containing protein [Myxococcota bacterium]HOH76031.1 NADH-ubiquinone oxidoreductase-F iron-sulfur binding region domain-containing protein [Myxococcota bacterium]HPV04144.1 NADH-ubiquinone oxidoreductase-F iron-sulfur binding region domain-containing protein [Myxococcota bacterium]